MTLQTRVVEKMALAGISNYHMDRDMLVLGGTRYQIGACSCGAADCDGILLEPVTPDPKPLAGRC